MAFVAVVMDGAFCAALGGFLVMHLNLLRAGCTTIEMYEKERAEPWPYNRGSLRRNLGEVFCGGGSGGGGGKRWWRCLVPTHTPDERRALLDSCLHASRLLASPPTPHSSDYSDAA